ncbi:MAG: dihydrodipicolinate synthase family protein [Blastocatellia bacterium]|nr:dihydrodipicolinate synthase family protein [Blastocatellia bacterium]MBK6425126.1 dihydrodipicolinate synthase family protein [Blastocatellia bacterium]
MGSERMVFVAAPTPFLASGAFDPDALRQNIGLWLEAGIDGILVLGTTGEAIHLDDAESDAVISVARAAVPAGRRLLVGTGRPTTAATIRATGRAADLGADLALVLTPHYYKNEMTPDVLGRHYREVADVSAIPILLYAMPALTGVQISAELGADLGRHPRIFGIKDSSGDVAMLFDRVERSNESFRILSGSGRTVLPALAAGVRGCILAIAAVAPDVAVAAHRAYSTGDEATARRAASLLMRLTDQLAPYGLGGLKAAMTVRGLRGGMCRSPLAFDPTAVRLIESALADAGLLTPALRKT